MEQEIKKGDVVVLKGDSSVILTVADIGEKGYSVQCYYFLDKHLKTEWIPVVALKHYEKPTQPEPEI